VLSLDKVSNHISEGVEYPPKSTYGHAKDHNNNKKETIVSSLPNVGPGLFNGCCTNVSPYNGSQEFDV
jgi:hypothetical protein